MNFKFKLSRRLAVSQLLLLTATTVVFLLFAASSAQAQDGRRGFWFGIGAGSGWDVTQGLDLDETPRGIAGFVRVGGTLTPQVLFGGEVIGRSVEEGDATLYRVNATFTMLIFPSSSGGFFVKGGIGPAIVAESFRGRNGSYRLGLGLTAGAGLDVRLGGNLYVTPNVDVLFQSFEVGANLRSTNRLLLCTIGLSWH